MYADFAEFVTGMCQSLKEGQEEKKKTDDVISEINYKIIDIVKECDKMQTKREAANVERELRSRIDEKL